MGMLRAHAPCSKKLHQEDGSNAIEVLYVPGCPNYQPPVERFWPLRDTVNPTLNGYRVTWQMPVSDFANLATTQQALFEGDGFYSTSYGTTCSNGLTCPLTLTQH
jgi:hypothetical protein